MKNFLIIDIGTSSLRVAIINEKLEILNIEVVKRSAGVCFDAEEEWDHIYQRMKAVIKSSDVKIDGMAVSSLLGWIGVDQHGNSVTPCYSYMHQCEEECKEFKLKYSDDLIYPISGRCISSELSVFKILNLKKEHREIYDKMSWFISLKDFINMKLTGIAAIDHTSACYTMLYNIKNQDWSREILGYTGVDSTKLARLIRPYEILGTVKGDIAAGLGITGNIPVAAGSVDGSTGILGAGAIESGLAVSVMGTTDVFFMVEDKLVFDQTKALIINPHVFPGLWLVGGPMGMYGGTLEWLLNNIMNKSSDMIEMGKMAEEIPSGSDGVTFLPTLAGERTPFWIPQMRGTMVGLEYRHKAQHLFRAVMESNGYAIRRCAELGRNAGIEFDRVIAIGGGSKSDLWLQLKADIMGVKVQRSSVEEATTIGACLLVMVATGFEMVTLPRIGIKETFYYQPEIKAGYDSLYQGYMKLHDKIAGLY
ncbi:MAG TPA: hypothetical protein GXX75_14540 [Clostridiales bacterium]|nr:hypothetical protein [Clostridiales bacterium]